MPVWQRELRSADSMRYEEQALMPRAIGKDFSSFIDCHLAPLL